MDISLVIRPAKKGEKMFSLAGRVTRKYLGRNFYGLLFVIPALVFFLIFKIFPVLTALWISFTKFNILQSPRFIGFENYIHIIHDPHFLHSLKVTLYYAAVSTAILLPLSLAVAIGLNGRIKFRALYRSLYFLPYMMSLFAVAIIWMLLYHPYGLMSGILGLFTSGQTSIRWLTTEAYALPSIIIMRVWWGTGYYMILFLAGLQSIPSEYYEVAKLDGANWWSSFWSITLPLLRPVLLFVIVISIINAFQTIDIFLIMTKGGPVDATRVLALLVYETGLKYFRMGEGSAMSVVLFVVLLVFTLIQLKVFREEVKY